MTLTPRRKGKDIPRLPLSAFTNAGASDTFPIPPTPSLITPTGIVDAHLHIADDQASGYSADISHLNRAQKRAVVLSSNGHAPETILASLPSIVDAPVLSVLLPFALDSTTTPEYQSPLAALTAVYDGATPVVPDAEDDTKVKAQVETPVNNLRWALQHARVVDLDIQGSIAAADTSFYDSLDNLLTKSIKSDTDTKRTPIVLTNVLPPPLDSVLPVVMMVNHPAYTTYRQRVSLLSLFDCVSVKLLPPPWLLTKSPTDNPDKELKNILKLLISPVLEAFGFERIIFGSSPAFGAGSPALAETWYNIVLESFRDLAVSQDEMDKIFIENAERVYGST